MANEVIERPNYANETEALSGAKALEKGFDPAANQRNREVARELVGNLRPHYGNERQALDVLRGEREVAETPEVEKPAVETERDEPESTARWSDADVRDLGIYQAAVQRTTAAAQDFQARYRAALQEHGVSTFEQLQAANPKLALRLKDDFRPIGEAAQWVQAATETIQYNVAVRQIEAERERLHAEIPALADETTREEFIEWLTRQGYSRDQILSVTDRSLVRLAWRSYQAEQPPKSIPKAKNRPSRKPQGNDEVSQARERLRRSGKMDDALAVLTARRQK
jgi:hypothetical protein